MAGAIGLGEMDRDTRGRLMGAVAALCYEQADAMLKARSA
jgi:hypothetical protein